MSEWQAYVVMSCAVILAIEPAARLSRIARNWLDRRAAHRTWQKSQGEK